MEMETETKRLCRVWQTGAVLALFTLMCLAAMPRPGQPEKGGGAYAQRRWNHEGPSRPQLYGKKWKEPAREDISFAALYGLEEYDVPEKRLDFDALRQEDNPHIYAWITIPDTCIDYPILQHPDQPDYYLTHNLDGSPGYPGCIYTQPDNRRDWSDNQTVVYGHNMRDGSMFAGLHGYGEEEFFAGHPYIYIYTEASVRVYRVFAAYPFSDDHLLREYDTGTDAGYGEYLQLACRSAQGGGRYDGEAAPEAGEPIITLSTCIADSPDRRYLVQAALEAVGELLK